MDKIQRIFTPVANDETQEQNPVMAEVSECTLAAVRCSSILRADLWPVMGYAIERFRSVLASRGDAGYRCKCLALLTIGNRCWTERRATSIHSSRSSCIFSVEICLALRSSTPWLSSSVLDREYRTGPSVSKEFHLVLGRYFSWDL